MNDSTLKSESASMNEHDAVVRYICEINQSRYTVLHNLEGEENNVAGIFPDIMLQDKGSKSLIFIIEVKKNGNIAPCIQQWKTVEKIPAFLYIIVPEKDLSTAKSVAQVVGLTVKFGSYSVDSNHNITVKYE